MDRRVVHFLTGYQYKNAEKELSLEEKTEMIKEAIKNKSRLEIVYLKPDDEKSVRIIKPKFIGDLQYEDFEFFGVHAFCCKRQQDRVFRVDRILEMRAVDI